MRLNVLETAPLHQDTVLANRITIRRDYVQCLVDKEKFTQYTCIFDKNIDEGAYRGQIGIFHGFAQCQDAFFETAFQFALNGFIVHLVDFEGFGFSSGKRIAGLTIELMHS